MSGGVLAKNPSSASRPPADAPMPTTGKLFVFFPEAGAVDFSVCLFFVEAVLDCFAIFFCLSFLVAAAINSQNQC
jgi:hypothetical protein